MDVRLFQDFREVNSYIDPDKISEEIFPNL
jgi:hypothetical protein